MNVFVRIPRDELDDAQARYDRSCVPLSDSGARIIATARQNLPKWDAAIAVAEAKLTEIRATLDWNKPGTYRAWEMAERNLSGLRRGRAACVTAAAMPRNLKAEVAEMVAFYGEARR